MSWQIFSSEDGVLMIRQTERKSIRLLTVQLLVLLLDIEEQQLKLERLHQAYIDRLVFVANVLLLH